MYSVCERLQIGISGRGTNGECQKAFPKMSHWPIVQNMSQMGVPCKMGEEVCSVQLLPSISVPLPPPPTNCSLLNNLLLLDNAGLVTMAANSQSSCPANVSMCAHTHLVVMWEGCPWVLQCFQVQLRDRPPVNRISNASIVRGKLCCTLA